MIYGATHGSRFAQTGALFARRQHSDHMFANAFPL